MTSKPTTESTSSVRQLIQTAPGRYDWAKTEKPNTSETPDLSQEQSISAVDQLADYMSVQSDYFQVVDQQEEKILDSLLRPSAENVTGVRLKLGKVQPHRTPLHLLDGVNRTWEFGDKKYPDQWNWTKAMAWSVPYDAALRHLSRWYMGETFDTESGQNHLNHAIANLLILVHAAEKHKDYDDRPVNTFA